MASAAASPACGAPYRFADAAGPLHGVRRDRVLVSVGSYCIVLDTVIEDLPAGSFTDRPWDVGNNPKTAVYECLKTIPSLRSTSASTTSCLLAWRRMDI